MRFIPEESEEAIELQHSPLRSQAIIEWKNEDVKRAFEQGLKQQTGAPSA